MGYGIVMSIQCYKCGRFVKKENADVSYDYYNGAYEIGYPECEKCKNTDNMTKITVISDTHGKHEQLDLDDDSSVLIHAGDVEARNKWDLREFLDWFEKQDYKHKVYVAGNHDFWLQRPDAQVARKGITYLQDSWVEIEGLKIWGSPWSLPFYNWAFMAEEDKLDEIYSKIPEDTDIIVNHGAPKGILDTALPDKTTGSKALAYHANRVSPKYCVFGHIHESYGEEIIGYTTYINTSVLNEKYELVNKPVSIEL